MSLDHTGRAWSALTSPPSSFTLSPFNAPEVPVYLWRDQLAIFAIADVVPTAVPTKTATNPEVSRTDKTSRLSITAPRFWIYLKFKVFVTPAIVENPVYFRNFSEAFSFRPTVPQVRVGSDQHHSASACPSPRGFPNRGVEQLEEIQKSLCSLWTDR